MDTELLDRSIDQLADELIDATEAELDERVRGLELLRRRIDAELAVTMAAAERRRVFRSDGHRNMKSYLRATCNWSNAEVAARRRVAQAGDHVPGLVEALHEGRIGTPQAAAIACVHRNPRVRDRLHEFAPVLLDLAERLPYDDFHLALRRFEMLADVDGAHTDRNDRHEHRNVHVATVGGTLHLDATGGDPLVNDELVAIFLRFCEHEFRHDTEAAAPSASGTVVDVVTDAHTFGLVLADAGLAPTADLAGAPIDPFTGLPVEGTRDLLRDLLVDPAEFASMRCETSRGTLLHPHDVLRAALAGHVRRVVVDARSVPIDMGRKQRLFTSAAREAAKLLVRHCEQAGCDLPEEFCDVDHIVEWNQNGRTDQDNAGVKCGHDNRGKHRRRSTTRRDIRGQAYTVHSDGSIILPVGARPPIFPDEADDDPAGDTALDAIDNAELTRIARTRARRLRHTA